MDKGKIVWSSRAENELLLVLEFYINRNGNPGYSTKLLDKVEKLVALLSDYPSLGYLTENKVTRVVVKEEFLIFYEVSNTSIEIVSFWDARQDPEKRIDKS